jgi:hypothetical protein
MTMTTTTARPSLRALARHLGCSHAALSKKVHTGLLRAGVTLDARGRVVVTDFDAAAAEWSSIHVPSVAEMMRGSPAHAPAAPMPPPDFFADLSKQDLLERWVAYDLLACALVLDALGADSGPPGGDSGPPGGDAFTERVTALLRRTAALRGADDVTLANAGALLREFVTEHGELAAELLGDSEARRQDDPAAMAAVAAVDHRG